MEMNSEPKNPTFGTFILLLLTLWALNIADIFQTLYLKQSGILQQEANFFIDYFLREGVTPFFWAKALALAFVTSVLMRGWFDKKGLKFQNALYTPDQVRRSIHNLLLILNIYYILIVVFPFVALAIAGLFSSL
jgi:hypothetical protein